MTTFLRRQLYPAVAAARPADASDRRGVSGRDHGRRAGRVPEPGERVAHRRRRSDGGLLASSARHSRIRNTSGAACPRRAPMATTPTPRPARTSVRPTRTLIDRVTTQVDELRAANGDAPIPVDLVTTSASGLDTDISPAGAEYQVARVAPARNMSEADVRAASPDIRRARCSASSARRGSMSSS